MLVPFDIPPGLSSDDTSFAMPGSWEAGSNVRFRDGRPEVIGGWTDAIPGNVLTGICRNARSWLSFTNLRYTVFGTHSKLQVHVSGNLYDITPSGLPEGSIDSNGEAPGYGGGGYGEGLYSAAPSTWYARTWSLDNYGDTLIANPRGGGIYTWELDVEEEAALLENAPDTVTCVLVTPERQVLAFGCNEEISDSFNPLCIRGSDIEDITNWTTAPDNNAFEHILEGGGKIVAARTIGPYVAVWTDSRLFLGQFIGNPGQAYRFDAVGEHCGLAAPNAVAVGDQTAVWLGSDYQFRIWTVGGVPQTLDCPIHRMFVTNIDKDQVDKVVATTIAQFEEVWFFYPDKRDGHENSRFVAYSAGESAKAQRPVWFAGKTARTQACDAGLTTYPLMTTPTGRAYFHEYGDTANGSQIEWNLQSTDTYLEEGGRELLVRRFIPDFEAQGSEVGLSIDLRRYPMASPLTYGPFSTEGKQKVDFRARGRLAAVKFTGKGFTRIGKPVFDATPMGQR